MFWCSVPKRGTTLQLPRSTSFLSGAARDAYFFFRAAAGGGHLVAVRGGGNQSVRIRIQAARDSARITPSPLRRVFESSPRAGSRIRARAELDYSILVSSRPRRRLPIMIPAPLGTFLFAADVIIQ